MADQFITCEILELGLLLCNGTYYDPEEKKLTYEDAWFWIYLGIYVGLVFTAGTCVFLY